MKTLSRSVAVQYLLAQRYIRHGRRYLAVAGKGRKPSLSLLNDDVKAVVQCLNSDIREKDNGYVEVKVCNLCSKSNKDKVDNLWKLNVRTDGSYYCFRCSVGGSLQDLKRKVNRNLSEPSEDSSSIEQISEISEVESESNKKMQNLYPHQTITHKFHLNLFPESPAAHPNPTQYNQAKEYLNKVRGLEDSVLKKYQVGYAVQQFLKDDTGVWEDHICITFPTIAAVKDLSSAKDIVFQGSEKGSSIGAKKPVKIGEEEYLTQRIKFRSIVHKGHQRVLPKGGVWGMFGWHTIPPLAPAPSSPTKAKVDPKSTARPKSPSTSVKDHYQNAIIITEGEYDCLACAQAISSHKKLKNIPVVSLPNGCNSFPSDLIPLLERFDRVYLYMDYDSPGQIAGEKIVKKLGANRCYLVLPPKGTVNPSKDANDAIRTVGNKYVVDSLLQARQLNHKNVETFSTLRESILQYIHRLQSNQEDVNVWEGTITPSLPYLTEVTKGFRRGEMVVLSGPTGCGKTTLLSQISLDFALQGALTLWGSFEVKNTHLLLKMLRQYYKSPSPPLFSLPPEDLNRVLDDFESLPLQFMNFYGATNIDMILEAMEYTVDKDDVQHIILDNLQFLLPRTHSNKSSFEKYDYQDLVLEKFRKFATEKNVNLTVVVHPRKEEDESILGLSSIGGSAKASQEADLVMLLQRSGGKMYLDVRKNRYDGSLGRIGLNFNADHCLFSGTTVDTRPQSFSASPSAIYGGSSGGVGVGGAGAGGGGGGSGGRGERWKK